MTGGHSYHDNPAEYLSRIPRLFRGYKERALAFLDLQPGERLVDVGCGTGDDLRFLADRFRGAVRLTGVEADPALLQRARDTAGSEGVTWVEGRLPLVPLPDACADVVRSDRVLQHLEDPLAALRDMRRLCVPGGRLVAADVDWGTLALDHPDPDLTDRLCAFGRDQHVQGRSGRRIQRWFQELGLRDITGYADAVWVRDWEVARFIWALDDLLARAVDANLLNSGEAGQWRDQAETYAREGRFSATMTAVVARGTVPGPGETD